VKDQQMGEEPPIFLGEERHQLLLDLHGIGLPTQAKQTAQPGDVGVDRNPFIDSKRIAEDDIGCLASHPWQAPELIHGAGYLAAVIGHHGLGHADEALGLVAEEPGGFDDLFQLGRVGPGQLDRGGVAPEQGGSDQIDPRVGALGREDGGTEQLVGVLVVQRATGVRVGLPEAGEDGGRADGGTAGLLGSYTGSLSQDFFMVLFLERKF
jgi:hypothetical protein